MRAHLLAAGLVIAAAAQAQDRDAAAAPADYTKVQAAQEGTPALPRRAPGWPEPVADSERYGFLLIDNLEWRGGDGPNGLAWDLQGWYGGDVNRIWLRSDGQRNERLRSGSEAEAELLYGRLVSPYFDAVGGIRYERKWEEDANPDRTSLAIGVIGLAPYRFEVSPTFYLTQDGDALARFTGSIDWLFTQRLILQPRLDADAAFGGVDRPGFRVGSGLDDVKLALRLRYEIRREFAPYIGVSWKRSYGDTADLLRQAGEATRETRVFVGLRMWF